MTDPVAISLITMVGTVLTAALTIINTVLARRNAEGIKETKTAIVETKAAVEGQKNTIATLEQNTNSMREELVKVTGKEQRAKGNLEGRAEQKAETRDSSEEHSG